MVDEKKPSLARFMGRNTVDDWLTKEIEAWYEKRGKGGWGPVKHKLRPSGAYSQCPREIQLKLLGYKGRISGQSQRRMDNGTKFHERQEELFIEMDIAALREETFFMDDVSGTPDITVARVKVPVGSSWDTEDLFLMELKSIYAAGFRKLPPPSSLAQTNMAALAKVQPGHLLQWLLYEQLVREGKTDKGEPLGLDMEQGFIFYENKDNQVYQYYFVVRDDALREKLAENARTALAWNRKGTLISAPFPMSSPVCKNCDARDICFREQNGDAGLRKVIRERLTETRRPAKVGR